VARGRAQQRELPVARIAAQVAGLEEPRASRLDRKRDARDAAGETHAEGLQQRLLQGPEVEEALAPGVALEGAQHLHLARGEEARGEGQRVAEPHAGLGVDADLDAFRHRAGREAGGVREVEAQRRAGARLRDLRLSVRSAPEPPGGGCHRRCARERAASQRMRHHEATSPARDAEARRTLALLRAEQRLAPRQLRLRDRLGRHQLDAHLVRPHRRTLPERAARCQAW